MKEDKTLMVFPCDFQIKIIGIHKESLTADVLKLARNYFPDTKETSIRSQASKQGNYLSLTLTVYVQDQKTLDLLYAELTKYPDIKWVL